MKKETDQTKIVRVYGIVQGVGFRPFVSRIADASGVKGSVANKGSYVEIYIQGSDEQRADFMHLLRTTPPPRSAILRIDESDCTELDGFFTEFNIIESEKETGDIFVSPDIATCPVCKKELYDPSDRRYMHPFINCTACGPRLTILDAMPYDRVRTSMGEFPMCPSCEYEYTHAETRRYDAQPVCCNDCGPEVYLIGREERGRAAITAARQAIMDGKIIAVKGIGGFHLCCDATNENAVARLRVLKNRPSKPFAVMMRDLQAAAKYCIVSENQQKILDGHQKPIILLERNGEIQLAPSVAPGNPKVGVMLPYAPVQMLLFDYNDGLTMTTDAFVMTSGNISGAPICRTDEDAISEISSFCDLILSHNRKIRLRADDSVMDFYEDEPYMIRRSRGYAPLPVMLSQQFDKKVLAIGGELKNTFCIGSRQLFYPSPYVGDMADMRTVNALRESVKRMEELLETEPEIVACDMHPKYNTTMVAKELGLPVFEVQHHYAHIVSCMAENDYSDPVIGVSFDGTGYGLDGSIWGGEFMIADYNGFERIGSIKGFDQIGGDASAKEGWRIAAAMINRLYGDDAPAVCEKLGITDGATSKVYKRMAERRVNTVTSTSCGRLFDAVSAVLGICRASCFEGEASTSLMFAAQAAGSGEVPETAMLYEKQADGQDPRKFILATDELFKYITEAKLSGKDSGQLAWVFHRLLADQITAGCKRAAESAGIHTCALSGGVFQNLLLLEMVEKSLKASGFTVLRHHLIPPNDGGIALGQAVAAMAYVTKKEKSDKL